VAKVIALQLPVLDPPDLGDTHAELWQAVKQGFPADGAAIAEPTTRRRRFQPHAPRKLCGRRRASQSPSKPESTDRLASGA